MARRITTNPAICGGMPIIRGTRVPVHVLLEFLAAGESIETLLKEFPQLSRNDVQAVFEYAAKLVRSEGATIHPRAFGARRRSEN